MTVDTHEPFGTLLRRYRIAAGLSQEALAERAGLGANTIASLERGRRTAPRLTTTGLLADALGLAPDDRATLLAAAVGTQAPSPAQEPVAPDVAPAQDNAPPRSATLPTPPTALVGREHDVAAVMHLVRRGVETSGSRLVTLLGPGGIGKTRLALAVAAAIQPAFPDGVVFVDLSTLRDPSLAPAMVAKALGLQEGTQHARDLLAGALQDKQVLLVLDNFEQVVEAAAFVVDLVARCPRVAILVTSRSALQVRGEQRYQVTPLALPDARHAPPLEALANYGAVRLFVERAQAVQPQFQLDSTNTAAVLAICRYLDGLPLAIELAAARIRILPPAALLARLTQGNRQGGASLLSGGPRDLPARQQTLRATIEWSYDLLGGQEQHVFTSLAVFAGGCTLEAVEAVCDLPALDVLASLVDKSLVQQTEHAGEPRFLLLETLREYGRARLEAEGALAALAQRHAAYYLAFVEAERPDLGGPRQRTWFARLESEHDNLRAAIEWAIESGEAELGLRIAGVLWRLWYVYGYLREGRHWLEHLLRLPATAPPRVRAQALRGAMVLSGELGDFAAAAAWGEQSLALFREIGDAEGIADALNSRANVAREQGDYAQATALYEESLARYRALGDLQGVAVALNNLGTAVRYQGDLARATALYSESLDLRRQRGDTRGIAWTLNNLGIVARVQADGARAKRYYVEALALSHAAGDRQQQARSLEGLAGVAIDEGRMADATRLFSAAATLRTAIGSAVPSGEQAARERDLRAARTALGAEAFAAAWAAGAVLDIDALVAERAGEAGAR
jgi:predicted ATPase/transcriptional regulator with XRE-family HTH domain